MTFKTRTEELRKAVEVLRPFVKEKEEDEDPYRISYRDKLFFEVFTDCAYLSVFIPGVCFTEKIWVESDENHVSFCLQIKEFCDFLERELEDGLTFEEDRFFGFYIWETGENGEKMVYTLMRAFSTTRLLTTRLEECLITPHRPLTFEKEFFIGTLEQLSKLGDSNSLIYISVENNDCISWIDCTNARMVFYDFIERLENIQDSLYIPNRFILKGGINLLQRGNSSCLNIYTNKYGKRIGDSNHFVFFYQGYIRYEIIAENIMLSYPFDTKDKIVVNSDSVWSFLRRARTLCESGVPAVFHLSRGYMTMHCYDPIYETGIHEYCSVLEGFNDIYLTIDTKSLLVFLEDIDAPSIQILRHSNGLLYLSSSDEDPFEDTLRILKPGEVKPEDLPYYQKESEALVKRFNPLS